MVVEYAADWELAGSGLCAIVARPYRHTAKEGRSVLNALIKSITGTFHVVQVVAGDKLDQLAGLLNLDPDEAAKLKASSSVVVVLGHGTQAPSS